MADNFSPIRLTDMDITDTIAHPNNKQGIKHKPNKAFYSLGCPFHVNSQVEVIDVIEDVRWGNKVILQCQICSTTYYRYN